MMNLSRFVLAMSLFVGSATSNNVPAASDLANEIRAWNDNVAVLSDELSRRLQATNAPSTADPVAAPTGSPTTAAGASMTVTDDPVDINIPGKFAYSGVDCSTITDADITTIQDRTNNSVKADACKAPLDPNKCTVTSKATCNNTRRKLVRGERHLATDTLDVVFNITVTSYCQSGDCSDVQAIITSVENTVEANLAGSTTGLTGLPTYIQSAVTALSSATVSVNAVLQDVIVPLLENLLNWYPDWHGGTNTCKNDGQYPFYMSRHGSYFRSTLKDCCEYYYGWALNECLTLGGGNTASLASDEFYADYDHEHCVQDCPTGTTGKNCGGLVEGNWVVKYTTASECCKGKFWWIDENVCIGQSSGNATAIATANAGSDKYYVDWENEKCVKDCAVSTTDAACGGLANKWDPLYTTADICCSTRLSYIARAQCTR
jgi:hypothetical protein